MAEEFKTCPVLEQYLENGTVLTMDEGHFLTPLSEYNLKRIDSILSQFRDSIGLDSTSVQIWREIIGFTLQNIAPNLKPSSWKRYRVSLNAIFNAALEKELAPVTFLRNLLGDISLVKVDHMEVAKEAKAHRIHVREFYVLRMAADSPDERLAVEWLEFNMLTSLRPNEVASCELIYPSEGAPFLRAPNTIKSEASKRNVESGEMSLYRDIDLTHLSMLDMLMIERFLFGMKLAIEHEDYNTVYNRLRNLLKKLSIKTLGHSVALSVGRTQYAANFKAMNPDNSEMLAEQMGHTDVTRPTRSYGAKHHGFTRLAIKDPEDVLAWESNDNASDE